MQDHYFLQVVVEDHLVRRGWPSHSGCWMPRCCPGRSPHTERWTAARRGRSASPWTRSPPWWTTSTSARRAGSQSLRSPGGGDWLSPHPPTCLLVFETFHLIVITAHAASIYFVRLKGFSLVGTPLVNLIYNPLPNKVTLRNFQYHSIFEEKFLKMVFMTKITPLFFLWVNFNQFETVQECRWMTAGGSVSKQLVTFAVSCHQQQQPEVRTTSTLPQSLITIQVVFAGKSWFCKNVLALILKIYQTLK